MAHYIYSIIGPSGVGKTTLTDAVFPKSRQLISFTSRQPRPGEQDGVDYYFIGPKTKNEIKVMMQSNDYLEVVEYNGNVYGYTFQEIRAKFDPQKQSVATVVTKEGYQHLRGTTYRDYVIPVFVSGSKELVKKHLMTRNDSVKNLEERLALYEKEVENEQWFNKLTGPKIAISVESNDLAQNVAYFKQQLEQLEAKRTTK